MPVTIENLANRPVLLCLNSGRTRRLAPREVLADIMDVEVNSNSRIQRLQEQRVITLRRTEKKDRPVRGSKAKAKPTKKDSDG
jgi:hypothetical protein